MAVQHEGYAPTEPCCYCARTTSAGIYIRDELPSPCAHETWEEFCAREEKIRDETKKLLGSVWDPETDDKSKTPPTD